MMKVGPSMVPLPRSQPASGLRFSEVPVLDTEEDGALIKDISETPHSPQSKTDNAYVTHRKLIQTQFGSRPGI